MTAKACKKGQMRIDGRCVDYRTFDGKIYTKSILKSNNAVMGIHKQKLQTMGIRHRVIRTKKGYRFYVIDKDD